MDRLIYIAPNKSSFVLQDIAFLDEYAKVTRYFFEVKYKLALPWYMIRLFFFLLFMKSQPILISFGGYHSLVATFVAKLKGVSAFIILNGIDSANIQEYQYGYLRGGVIRWCCKISYNWATQLLPVSESLMNTTTQYGFEKPKELGLRNEFPKKRFKYQVTPNGFDLGFWKSNSRKEAHSFITVVGSVKRIQLKGLDLIFEIAQKLPNCIFYVAGLDQMANVPENVKMLGYQTPEQLRTVYSQAQFYLQLSVWEGFGCALCEAMLCACIPIVSNVNALPTIIGESGYVLNNRNPDSLFSLITQAINDNRKTVLMEKANETISNNYPMSNRVSALISLLRSGN